jgi:HTH-type transcriptional regulator / antitoxin HigA
MRTKDTAITGKMTKKGGFKRGYQDRGSGVLPRGKLSKKAVARQEYRDLVSRTLPHIIRTEAENEHYVDVLALLCAKSHPTAAEKELIALWTLLIEEFEERHYALKAGSPIDHLTELMDANDLKQKDLADIFGTPSIVSEVLHGKRHLTTQHIRQLCERFHVSPELFI